MRLHITREALDALFPADSEARVELTRSVAAALVEKLAIKEVKFLDASLHQRVAALAKSEVEKTSKELGLTEGYYNATLSGNAVEAIKKSVFAHYTSVIQGELGKVQGEIVNFCVKEQKNYLTGVIQRMDDKAFTELVDTRLKVILKGLA